LAALVRLDGLLLSGLESEHGGTDLFLALAGQECGFPVIDCAARHIAALAQAAAIKEVNHGT